MTSGAQVEFLPLTFVCVLIGVTLRYLLFSGAAWAWARGRPNRLDAATKTIELEEIWRSLIAALFFAAAAVFVILLEKKGGTRIYFDPMKLGAWYLVASFPLVLLLHEAYFYFLHRLMHVPAFYRYVHAAHHRSKNPTAFAAFSFSPAEAALEALALPLLVCLVPMHIAVFVGWVTFMSLAGTLNHIGVEVFPAGTSHHWLGKWWITPTNHFLHHQRSKGNYGLYFTLFDRILGTRLPESREKLSRDAALGKSADVIIVGGGLAGSLTAIRILETHPDLSVLVFDEGNPRGLERTWSFHESDLPCDVLKWLLPFVSASWPGYDVSFPDFRRHVTGRYYSIQSEDFFAKVRSRLGSRLRTTADVVLVEKDKVGLSSGEEFRAPVVLDSRGLALSFAGEGYQKFVGLELILEEPHGLKFPHLMDADVAQLDGFRFFYLLPWSERSVLIEDTRYSNTPDLNALDFHEEILGYARNRGWKVHSVARHEFGILPIPFFGTAAASFAIGTRGLFFHPTTGYSIAYAADVAYRLAGSKKITPESVAAILASLRFRRSLRAAFYHALNRMLFLACAPEKRIGVFARFYRMPDGLLRRFYRGESSLWDCFRILCGKPPVPLIEGISALLRPGCKEAQS